MKSSLAKIVFVASAVFIACAASVIQARADTIAFNENGTPNSTPAATGLVGFEFTVNEPLEVTQLGFYAQSIGGGDTPQVSLFNVTSGFVASPTPMYSTGDINTATPPNVITTEPGWNYYSVGTPILLTVGNTYAVTAPIYFSEQYNSTSGFTYGSAISTPTYLLAPGGFSGWSNSGYNFTTLAATSPGANISANFQYTVAEVPEPSSVAMLSAGLLALIIVLRRRSAKLAL